MRVFDQVSRADLERREWQLWLMAFAVIAILAAGTALLMYPSAFSAPLVVAGDVQRKAFFGFCALSVLVIGYLVDRQILVRNLHKQIEEERSLMLRVRQKSSTDLLQTLPGAGAFGDRLTMEHRRAVSLGQPLSVILAVLSGTLSPHEQRSTQPLLDPAETSIAFGDAAKALLGKLRSEDSMFHLNSGVFCVLLPNVDERNAYRVSERLAEGLRDASGVTKRFSFDIQTFNYPERFKSATEIEGAVRPFLRTEAASPTPA
jgi:GGDEF domain-containing protein